MRQDELIDRGIEEELLEKLFTSFDLIEMLRKTKAGTGVIGELTAGKTIALPQIVALLPNNVLENKIS